jgi:chromosome segregation ATPase
MIEEIMIFALGFLVAGILALLVLPLFWRRALRLSRRRVEMQIPLSMAEVVADRDRVRASFAVERCRLEESIDVLVEKNAEAMSRAGRAETETAALRKKLVADEQKMTAAVFRAHELESQLGALGKELHDADALLSARTDDLARWRKEHRSLTEVGEERRALNASLETRLSAVEMRFADALRDLAGAKNAEAQRAEEARLAAERRDLALKQAAALENRRLELESRTADRERRLDETAASLERTRQDLAEARREADEFGRQVSFAEERAKALRNSLERNSEARRTQDKELAERLKATESQVVELKAALEEAREDNASLRRPTGQRRRRGPRSLKGLEVVVAEPTEQRPDSSPRAEDSLLDRPA